MMNASNRKPGYLRTAANLAGVMLAIGGAATMPAAAAEVLARPTAAFLDSIGVVSTFEDRGQPSEKTLEMLRFGGFRWLRGGIEGLSENGPLKIDSFLRLHKEAGVKISWGLGSGIGDLDRLLSEETGLPVLVAADPLTCVVRGCGMALERMERLGSIFTSE